MVCLHLATWVNRVTYYYQLASVVVRRLSSFVRYMLRLLLENCTINLNQIWNVAYLKVKETRLWNVATPTQREDNFGVK